MWIQACRRLSWESSLSRFPFLSFFLPSSLSPFHPFFFSLFLSLFVTNLTVPKEMETPALSDFQACKFADGGNSSVKRKKSHDACSNTARHATRQEINPWLGSGLPMEATDLLHCWAPNDEQSAPHEFCTHLPLYIFPSYPGNEWDWSWVHLLLSGE